MYESAAQGRPRLLHLRLRQKSQSFMLYEAGGHHPQGHWVTLGRRALSHLAHLGDVRETRFHLYMSLQEKNSHQKFSATF